MKRSKVFVNIETVKGHQKQKETLKFFIRLCFHFNIFKKNSTVKIVNAQRGPTSQFYEMTVECTELGAVIVTIEKKKNSKPSEQSAI